MILHRRHLNSSQRAVIALDMLPMLEAEAKERQGTRTDLDATSVKELTDVRRASDQAAKLAKTNRQYVNDVKKLAAKSPSVSLGV